MTTPPAALPEAGWAGREQRTVEHLAFAAVYRDTFGRPAAWGKVARLADAGVPVTLLPVVADLCSRSVARWGDTNRALFAMQGSMLDLAALWLPCQMPLGDVVGWLQVMAGAPNCQAALDAYTEWSGWLQDDPATPAPQWAHLTALPGAVAAREWAAGLAPGEALHVPPDDLAQMAALRGWIVPGAH